MAAAQEKRLWFVFRLFYYLVRASRCFFLPLSNEATASFSLSFDLLFRSKPSRFRTISNAKPLHSYKTAFSATSLPSKLQKSTVTPPSMPRLQHQVRVSGQRVLTKLLGFFKVRVYIHHFQFSFYILALIK